MSWRSGPRTVHCLIIAGMIVVGSPVLVRAEDPADPTVEVPSGAAPAVPAGSAATAQPGKSDRSKLDDPDGILSLDIDQLGKVAVTAPSLNMEVSTVQRTESTVGRTPAAVFVITSEMIRRSGALTIPDVLRLAPGVEVQQKTASQWAIAIRGFNDLYSDKLLIQIDGRQVYTPLFGGTFWDVQDLVLEDIERIEVIRGPGGTLWGANAVNGVINIITKGSKETQGGYFQAGAGTEQRGFSTARYGGKLGDNATYRVYGKWFERDTSIDPDGKASDDWRQARSGFRVDWTPQAADTFTLQGDGYNGYVGNEVTIASPSPPFTSHYEKDQHVSGDDILGRWTHVLDKDSDWSLQWYYEQAQRHDQLLPLMTDYDVMDLDFQHRFPLSDTHALIWGLGYRNYSDTTRGIPYNIEFAPSSRTDDQYSCFVQDQITLREDLFYFIVGSKFEHNNYTGFEMQPTARLLWTPDEKHCLWTAVSRAVQNPTRLMANGIGMDRPTFLPDDTPVFPVYHGNPSLDAPEVIAYEAGMRAQPTKEFYWDLALFYNDYQHLLGYIPGEPYGGLTTTGWPAGFLPASAASIIPAQTYGFELAGGYQFTPRWNLRAAYSFLRMLNHEPPGVVPYYDEGIDPRNQFYLWLSGDLGEHWYLDLIGRYVDSLNTAGQYADHIAYFTVPSYFVADVRLAWRPTKHVEWAVVGRNLFAGAHREALDWEPLGGMATDVQEEVYGGLTCRF